MPPSVAISPDGKVAVLRHRPRSEDRLRMPSPMSLVSGRGRDGQRCKHRGGRRDDDHGVGIRNAQGMRNHLLVGDRDRDQCAHHHELLGLSRSALSQTVRALERRLDLKLLNRTTRSVSPTEAGERLYQTVGPRFADIEAELAVLGELRGKPAGTVRITATEHAVRTLVWPRLQPWLPRVPDIRVEISSDNRFTDIVAARFDTGVRLGADVAKDMIALRMVPDLRVTVVGSPAYFARHARPRTPPDLTEHDCIGLRTTRATVPRRLWRWWCKRCGLPKAGDPRARPLHESRCTC
jgi:DNA-binding transcriptional LysR family regulator